MTASLFPLSSDGSLLSTSRAFPWTAVIVLVAIGWIASFYFQPASRYPVINHDKSAWTSAGAKLAYIRNARELLAEGYRKFAGQPFRILTDQGHVIMLPTEMIDAVNAEPSLSFIEFSKQRNLSHFETFRTFRPAAPGLFNDAIMKGLTRSLPKFTEPLSQEMTSCLDDTWGDSREWHEVPVKKDILKWVAHLSTRIFLPFSFTKNAEWLRLSVDFTVNAFTAAAICRLFGPFKWVAERLLPICRGVRKDYRACAAMLKPVFDERNREIEAAKREERKAEVPDDAIEWFRDASKGRDYEQTDIQIALQLAAIHTTSDLLCQAVLDLCAHPELIEPLRQEAISTLQKYGWQKVALTELRLLDSFFKETQRLKPISMASLYRCAIADVELPHGILIKKGERTSFSCARMWSADDYADPDRFDGYRFLERRKIPGLENRSLLVSTSLDHLGFAHGKHACPGRFFAANEVKIAMVHLLLKYDMRIREPSVAKWGTYGVSMFTNPKATISVRRRESEIDLETLAHDL